MAPVSMVRVPAVRHGVLRVDSEVQDDLFHLSGISLDPWNVRRRDAAGYQSFSESFEREVSPLSELLGSDSQAASRFLPCD